jgi:hypothetical protein
VRWLPRSLVVCAALPLLVGCRSSMPLDAAPRVTSGQGTNAPSASTGSPTPGDGLASPTAPHVLAVACSPQGLAVSADTVAAQPGGVVLRVSSTLPAGSYLNYGEGPGTAGGGSALPQRPATWTLPMLRPGVVHLSCTLDGEPSSSRAQRDVTVTDPDGFWQDTTLAALGCRIDTITDWISGIGGQGRTPEAAVNGVLTHFHQPGRTLTAAPAGIGYRDAVPQTWLVSDNGQPFITVAVVPARHGFSAGPDAQCSSH